MVDRHAGIREIGIRDFRGIDELTLAFVGPNDYPTRIGVIGGPNGSGKTAVLEACLVAGGYEHLTRGKVGEQAIRAGARDYRIDVAIQVQEEVLKLHATAGRKGQSHVPMAYFSSWRAPQLVGSLGITAGKRGKRPAHSEQNRLLNIKQYLINARAHQFFPKSSPPAKSRYQSVAEDLDHVWNLFYPGQTFVVEPVGEEPEEGFDIFVSDGRKRLPVDALSSGQLEIFMFAGGLAIEDFQQGIIIIDEPELHLDPQWHRTVLRALQYLKPECQILVGTHSPGVFDSVMSFERHFLVPEDDPRATAWLAGAGQGGRA